MIGNVANKTTIWEEIQKDSRKRLFAKILNLITAFNGLFPKKPAIFNLFSNLGTICLLEDSSICGGLRHLSVLISGEGGLDGPGKEKGDNLARGEAEKT